MSPGIVFGLVFVGAVMSAVGGVLLKLGAERLTGEPSLWILLQEIFFNWRILAGLGMYFIPALLWIWMLRKVELSLLQPLMAMVYVVTPILAICFLGEQVSRLRWAGIAVVIVGVVMISRS